MEMEKGTQKRAPGSPEPLGVSYSDEKVNFSIYCPRAKYLQILIFTPKSSVLWAQIPFDPEINRTGDVWHIALRDLPKEFCYGYQIDGESIALDPYAKNLIYENLLLGKEYFPPSEKSFDWEYDRFPHHPMSDLVIYEMHVKGFSVDIASQVTHPGTFSGIIEKIPYLLDLGINAIELLPVQEFDQKNFYLHSPIDNQKLYNYWGYSTINFFSLKNSYGAFPDDGAKVIEEFKTMVKELHRNKIEVILDVVFNHTFEGNEQGPSSSFKILAASTYYILTNHGEFSNYTGCGNTFNCNHPIAMELIIKVLRYWVVEMRVDGFRFDLASIFFRDSNGAVLPSSPLVEAISKDPVLAKTKLIAEPWDAIGLYQVGNFYPHEPRWSEWNGAYRDTVRRYIQGHGSKEEFATRISGSQDFYGNRGSSSSINFITSHDGFTLADLVSYNLKHNFANGENNHDGNSFNDSWNCGIEGITLDASVIALRERQMRNFHLALMISQGVPMISMGDEYGHTKYGNNNTWNQDNVLNWFLWDQLEKKKDFFRFYRSMIEFRRQHPILRQNKFLTDNDIEWHGCEIGKPKWHSPPLLIAFTLKDPTCGNDLFIAFNPEHYMQTIAIPQLQKGKIWNWVVDTAKAPPEDFISNKIAAPLDSIDMQPHSAILLELCSLF